MSNVEFIGLDQAMKNMEKAIGRFYFKVGKENLEKAAEYVMEESKKLVPEMDQTLLKSAYVKKVGFFIALHNILSRKSLSSMIGYSAPYALRVHENPRSGKTEGLRPPPSKKKYKKWATKGQWKFLEQVLLQNKKQILDILAGRR